MLQGQSGIERRSELQDVFSDKYTHCVYLDPNLFMAPPIIMMQGRMDEHARARRHDRANARIKPTKNALTKVIARVTFSDIPSCTRSISEQHYFNRPPLKSPK
jgi:hypothetical protein